MKIKRYLLSLIAMLCVFVFSGCSLFVVNTVKDSGIEEVYSESTEIEIESSDSDDGSSVSIGEGESWYTSDCTGSGDYVEDTTTADPNEDESDEQISESYPVDEEYVSDESELISESYPADEEEFIEDEELIDIDGSYTTKEDVALYIYTYGCLPNNFMTKSEAQDLGWEGGSLEPYAPGMCIGGNRFGNYEGLLPEADGRTYTECDIDTLGADKRGAKRIVFSNDGLIYYTEDHYESFELLYGEE